MSTSGNHFSVTSHKEAFGIGSISMLFENISSLLDDCLQACTQSSSLKGEAFLLAELGQMLVCRRAGLSLAAELGRRCQTPPVDSTKHLCWWGRKQYKACPKNTSLTLNGTDTV